jgi:hypothetical protein
LLYPGDHYLDIPFTFGTPLSLYAFSKVYADAKAGKEATGNGYADLGNSIYWGGIASITNSNGAPVTDFTAFGATGHDWVESSVPVPEPETYALLLGGDRYVGSYPPKGSSEPTVSDAVAVSRRFHAERHSAITG